MHARSILPILLLAGCTSVEPSGGWMPPTTPAERAEAPDPEPEPEPDPGHALDQAAEELEAEAEAELAALDDGTHEEVAPEPEVEEPVAHPPEPVAVGGGDELPVLEDEPEPRWDPSKPVPTDWGVRLVSTIPDAQPPRAVLALAQGGERVVKPGDLLPGARIVVLAIGQEAVQIAHVEPRGDHADVRTETLWPFHGRDPRPAE